MDERIDLAEAAEQIMRRTAQWERDGFQVGAITWREQGEGWPPQLKTDRSTVVRADSIGVRLTKRPQEGEVVLFSGGWTDFVYWRGGAADEPVHDTPGWEDWLDVQQFGSVLDRLAGMFV